MATSGSRPVPFLAEPAASRLGYEDLNKYNKITNLMSTKKKCPTKPALWFQWETKSTYRFLGFS